MCLSQELTKAYHKRLPSWRGDWKGQRAKYNIKWDSDPVVLVDVKLGWRADVQMLSDTSAKDVQTSTRARKQWKAVTSDTRPALVRFFDTMRGSPELCSSGVRDTQRALEFYIVEELFVIEGKSHGGLDIEVWEEKAAEHRVPPAAVHRICQDSRANPQVVRDFQKLGVACILSRPLDDISSDDEDLDFLSPALRSAPDKSVPPVCEPDQCILAVPSYEEPSEQEKCRLVNPSGQEAITGSSEEGTLSDIADQLLIWLGNALVQELNEEASAIGDFIHAALNGAADSSESLDEALQGVVSMLKDCGAPECARELLLWWQALSVCSGNAAANPQDNSSLVQHDAIDAKPVSIVGAPRGEVAEPLQSHDAIAVKPLCISRVSRDEVAEPLQSHDAVGVEPVSIMRVSSGELLEPLQSRRRLGRVVDNVAWYGLGSEMLNIDPCDSNVSRCEVYAASRRGPFRRHEMSDA